MPTGQENHWLQPSQKRHEHPMDLPPRDSNNSTKWIIPTPRLGHLKGMGQLNPAHWPSAARHACLAEHARSNAMLMWLACRVVAAQAGNVPRPVSCPCASHAGGTSNPDLPLIACSPTYMRCRKLDLAAAKEKSRRSSVSLTVSKAGL
jgi:hypothetical protein